MKFLCDQMCGGLGKWLRIAGYDTLIIETSMPDQKIWQMARDEKRTLLTRDTHFLEMGGDHVIVLQGNTIEECAEELIHKIGIDWLYAPFSRCLICNNGLTAMSGPYWYCLHCHKMYWDGSHTKRMLQQLHKWQEAV